MRSLFADKFNHDPDAPDYDVEVQDAGDPVRAGYDELLSWVAAHGEASPRHNAVILDLGAGTGNLALRLKRFHRLVCVDVSREMIRIGQAKLAARAGSISWVLADLLEFFDVPRGPFHAVLSTYAIHHLTEEEKVALFERIWNVLIPGGTACFGDLMFENPGAQQRYLEACRLSGHRELLGDIEDEFFWDVERAVEALGHLGFTVGVKRFSDLSWGITAVKPADA